MNDNERAHRGEETRRLLENPILIEALSLLETRYIEAWKTAKTVEAREDAHRYVQLKKLFESDLKALVNDGQFAADRLKELEGKPSRKFWG